MLKQYLENNETTPLTEQIEEMEFLRDHLVDDLEGDAKIDTIGGYFRTTYHNGNTY